MEENIFNFNDCTLPELDKMFGLRWVRPSKSLDDWIALAATTSLTDYETASCIHLKNLVDRGHFISKIASLLTKPSGLAPAF